MKTDTFIKRSSKGMIYKALATGVLVIAIGFITQPLMAKPWGWPGQSRSADEIVQTLTDRLALTEEQTAAIRPVIEEKVRKMNEIRADRGTDRQAVRTEMQKLRWDTERKLQEILTDEQVDKYLTLRQEQRDRMGKGGFRGGKMHRGFNKTPEQVMERLRVRLNLTPEQAEEIAPVIQESMEKKRAVFEKFGAQRQNTRQAMRAEMRTIGDETEAELATILTDEQLDTLRTFRDKRRAWMDKRMNRPGPGF